MIETGRQYLPNELLVLLCRLLAQTPYRNKLSVNNLKNINEGTCLIQQKIARAESLMKKIADNWENCCWNLGGGVKTPPLHFRVTVLKFLDFTASVMFSEHLRSNSK